MTKAKVVVQEVDIPDGLGLSYSKTTGDLQGVPLLPGEYRLTVYFTIENGDAPKPLLLEGECPLIINPDPRTLWRNEPSDKTDPYWKQDEDSLTIHGDDGLRMIAVSKRGRSHAHVGSFRDDDFCLYGKNANGWRVLTVADGAGAYKLSRRGSFVASRRASEHVNDGLRSAAKDQEIKQALGLWGSDRSSGTKQIKDELYYLFGEAAQEAVRAIDEEANSKGIPYKEYSTTLLMAIHKQFEIGHFIGAYWVGDGAIGLYRRRHEIRMLGKPDSGEFAGEAKFLDRSIVSNAKDIWDRITFEIVPTFTALAVMTDGVSDPCFETDVGLTTVSKWDQFWEQMAPCLAGDDPESSLRAWLDFWSVGNHDDRTIALLYGDTSAGSSLSDGMAHE